MELATLTDEERLLKKGASSPEPGLTAALVHRRIVTRLGVGKWQKKTVEQYLSPSGIRQIPYRLLLLVANVLEVSPLVLITPPSPDASRFLEVIRSLDRRGAIDAEEYESMLFSVDAILGCAARVGPGAPQAEFWNRMVAAANDAAQS
jgi:hypothetical protein